MGLLDYRKNTTLPIRELTKLLLRGESTLTEGKCELITSVVSYGNECTFCTDAHSAAATGFLQDASIAEKAK